jgi:hypothetical protein
MDRHSWEYPRFVGLLALELKVVALSPLHRFKTCLRKKRKERDPLLLLAYGGIDIYGPQIDVLFEPEFYGVFQSES